jgi:hypothetical protein
MAYQKIILTANNEYFAMRSGSNIKQMFYE